MLAVLAVLRLQHKEHLVPILFSVLSLPLVEVAVGQVMVEQRQVSLVVLVVAEVGTWVQVAQETLQALLHRKETMVEPQEILVRMVQQAEAVLLLLVLTAWVQTVVQERLQVLRAVL